MQWITNITLSCLTVFQNYELLRIAVELNNFYILTTSAGGSDPLWPDPDPTYQKTGSDSGSCSGPGPAFC
jgi:hypothetical protein